jgi:CRISPR-associated endoribonuclease Cas6
MDFFAVYFFHNFSTYTGNGIKFPKHRQVNFRLTLSCQQGGSILPCNYQYPLAATIYHILSRADTDYARFLHNEGYRVPGSLKAFKLFTFSDLRTPFNIISDRLHLLTSRAELLICFHLPKAAENFIKGLFVNRDIELADKKSKAFFTITTVETVAYPLNDDPVQEVLLNPLSPLVCGWKNERGNYDYLAPDDNRYPQVLLQNWKEKYASLHGWRDDQDMQDAAIRILYYANPPKSRLVTIKANSDAETRIRGFVNFRLKAHGKKEALELLLNSGVGLYNAMGMGCVG